MLISLHHLLFVLLPVAMAVRLYVKPRPAAHDVANGIARFCLGIGKWVLLVDPLWHLATMTFRGGPESLGTSVAWMGFLGLLLSLHFACTAAGDVIAGLGGMFGFKVAEPVQEVLTLRRFTQGNWLRLIVLLLVITVIGALVQTASLGDTWLHLKALFAPPTRTIPTLIQQARVRTDFHVLTIFAALVCLIGLPHSRDFLREPAPWKATICLLIFTFAVAMLWTHAAPMS
ncbi:MAG: hypothetical protein WAW39_26445 [Prosthecobacter sp.]|uniref:hypothetical protein n=1 Tax=Prosthecobacter sp. TaxID=1965333 RepID=UPI003BB01AE6